MPLPEVPLLLGLALLVGANGHIHTLLSAVPRGAALSGHPRISRAFTHGPVHQPVQHFWQGRPCTGVGPRLGVPHTYAGQPCLLCTPLPEPGECDKRNRRSLGKSRRKTFWQLVGLWYLSSGIGVCTLPNARHFPRGASCGGCSLSLAAAAVVGTSARSSAAPGRLLRGVCERCLRHRLDASTANAVRIALASREPHSPCRDGKPRGSRDTECFGGLLTRSLA